MFPLEVVSEKFQNDGYVPLPLPYLVGMLTKQKILQGFFPRDIQTVELIDPHCFFAHRDREYAPCLRRIDGEIKLCLSEYMSNHTVNASGRISPSSVRFLVCESKEERFEEVIGEEVKEDKKETPYEYHIRMTTAKIG